MKSSVKVPVLSKTIILTFPAEFIVGGEIQLIPFYFNLPIANIVPTSITIGKAGGTAIVTS